MSSLAEIIESLNQMGINPADLNLEIERLEYEISSFINKEGLKCQHEHLNLTSETL